MYLAGRILIVLGIALTTGVVWKLLARQQHRNLPVFFAYLLFSLTSSIGGLATLSIPRLYPYVYWSSEIIGVMLALLAIHESFFRVFRAFYAIRAFPFILPILVLCVAAYSYWLAIVHPSIHGSPLFAAIVSSEIGIRYIQAAMFLLFIVLVKMFKPLSVEPMAGIVDGFGVAACGILLASLIRSVSGINFPIVIQFGAPVTYILGTLFWLNALWHPIPVSSSPMSLEKMAEVIRQYHDSLRKAFGE